MRFALDWDGTANQDLILWGSFIHLAQALGREVCIVTMRYPSEVEADPVMGDFRTKYGLVVYTTSREAKKPHMDKAGIPIHVWIDDTPAAVLASADEVWGRATPEGRVVEGNGTALKDEEDPDQHVGVYLLANGKRQLWVVGNSYAEVSGKIQDRVPGPGLWSTYEKAPEVFELTLKKAGALSDPRGHVWEIMKMKCSDVKTFYAPHDLYETGDEGVPEVITDSNGEVCLGLCKVCGRGESELELDDGRCPGPKVVTPPAASVEEPKAVRARRLLKEALQEDPEYAWGWHCSIWAGAHDEGLETGAANRAAARVMYTAFDIDTSKHPHFDKEYLATPKPRAERAKELVDNGLCREAPAGWLCTRPGGHEGPCAAHAVGGEVKFGGREPRFRAPSTMSPAVKTAAERLGDTILKASGGEIDGLLTDFMTLVFAATPYAAEPKAARTPSVSELDRVHTYLQDGQITRSRARELLELAETRPLGEEDFPVWEASVYTLSDDQTPVEALKELQPFVAMIQKHAGLIDQDERTYFELAYTRTTGWMVFITDVPGFARTEVVNPGRNILFRGQGDTFTKACEDALKKETAK